jgi:transcriptional regulator with XRE-family HTH domain
MASTSVDVASLHAALDAARSARNLSWRQLAARLDLSPSTLSRLSNGYTPDTAAFASMVTWLSVPAEDFMRSEQVEGEVKQPDLLAQLAPVLRGRKDLTPEQIQHLEQLIGSAVQHFDSDRSRDG